MKHLLISLICMSLFSFAGNEANLIRSIEAVNTTPTLTSIALESNATTLNVGDTVQLTVIGTYSDGSSSAIDENITYTIHPTENVEVNGSVLRAKKDGNVTVQASIDGVNSNTITLNITWVVNGHVLPPEPDKALNDSTLLGIDVNDNGVRDDVERFIYKNYEQPIERGIFMQSSRAYNSLLITEPVKHKENEKMNNAASCHQYWIFEANPKPFDKYDFYSHRNDVKAIQFNTVKRLVAKRKYELSLSGGVYSLVPIFKEKCEFDENGILGKIK